VLQDITRHNVLK